MSLVNQIEVKEPQILTEMSAETLEKKIDLSQLSEQELQDALAKKKNHKNQQIKRINQLMEVQHT